MERWRKPWLSSDTLFALTPLGREHRAHLKITHRFTNDVILSLAIIRFVVILAAVLFQFIYEFRKRELFYRINIKNSGILNSCDTDYCIKHYSEIELLRDSTSTRYGVEFVLNMLSYVIIFMIQYVMYFCRLYVGGGIS